MSRRSQAPTRTILPDPKFNSVLLAKFMNMVMERGKKSVAERIVYGAIDRIAEKTGQPADQAHRAADAGARQREADGRGEVAPRRRRHLPGAGRSALARAARRWPCAGSSRPPRARSEKSMAQRLAAELLEASENRGAAVRKREDTHRMADANKAFAHYRW